MRGTPLVYVGLIAIFVCASGAPTFRQRLSPKESPSNSLFVEPRGQPFMPLTRPIQIHLGVDTARRKLGANDGAKSGNPTGEVPGEVRKGWCPIDLLPCARLHVNGLDMRGVHADRVGPIWTYLVGRGEALTRGSGARGTPETPPAEVQWKLSSRAAGQIASGTFYGLLIGGGLLSLGL
jgi:hypothetical protein